MTEKSQPVRVAVNAMRARQTVVGFNITIVAFQLGQLYRHIGGISVPGFEHPIHVRADIALFMSLALSLIALLAMTMSSIFDEVGVCTHWSLVAGDVLMYMSLAYTVSGFFAPLQETMRVFTMNLPTLAAEARILQKAVLISAGIAWFLAIYVGPVASLLRSPFPLRINITMGVTYLAVLLILAWVNAQANMIEAAGLGKQPDVFVPILRELVQPLGW